MSWKKYFKPVNSALPTSQRTVDTTSSYAQNSKYNNWLPEVYSGPPDRLQRYSVLEQMCADHEISAALDTMADFGTGTDPVSKLPFIIKFNEEPTPSEVQVIEKSLAQWVKLNKFNRRLWGIFRSVLAFGDQFFIRDPQTYKLYWIDPSKVEKAIVNESNGKKIESYFIKDVDLNTQSLVATNQLNKLSSQAYGSNSIIFSPPMQGNINYISAGYGGAGRANYQNGGAVSVDAEHIVQISLSDGMSMTWPFGTSVLETIYKVYKQKEMIEDAILIYRIHRAPERRIFYIDVGTMPPNKASANLEKVKYEVQQKLIHSKTVGGSNISDSTYNPMCFDMSTRIPLLDGRILSITDIAKEYRAGKENWVYSCDPITGKIVPGIITWAGITKKSASVIKLTLDDGNTIICTPDHKIPVLGKGFVEAKDLTIYDPLISYVTKLCNVNNLGILHSQVYDHEINDWVTTETMINNFFNNILLPTRNTTHNSKQKLNLNQDILTRLVEIVKENDASQSKTIQIAKVDGKLLSLIKSINVGVRKITSSILTEIYTHFGFKNWDDLKSKACNYNHRIINIEYINDPIDVGTITIDGKEKWHNYHTFALESGIFVKNSTLEDYYFAVTSEGRGSKVEVLPGGDNLGCFSLDTKVKLLDGRDLTILEVRDELEQGKTLFTYSCHPETGEIAPGLISGAGVTQSHTKVIELHLSNNQVIRCTPDHKFPIVNKGFIEASNLEIGIQLNSRFGEPIYLSSITDVEELIGVGTLTIDHNETFHNWHTYLLSSGVFVKNSIDDLRYFNNKMLRGLGVPSSYLPTGPDDGTASMTDGRVGTAFIQEFRFSKVISRYQQLMVEPLDMEFKLFLKHRGITLDSSLFDIEFTEPQSFSEYRQLELDSARINLFTALTDIPFVSKRYILKTYLGWSQEQLTENERMWKEERSKLTKTFAPANISSNGAAGLSDIGITSSGIDNMSAGNDLSDDDGANDMNNDNDMNDQGPPNVSNTEVNGFGDQ